MDEPRVIGPGFHDQVYRVVCLVPPGKVTTYGDVGTVLGSPRVARQVGWALAALRSADRPEVPWHRVVNAQGFISHRGDPIRGPEQQHLLEAEGIVFREDGRIELKKLRWTYENLPPEFK